MGTVSPPRPPVVADALAGHEDDAPSSARAISGGSWNVRRPRALLHVAVFGGFLLLAVLMWWQVWLGGHPTTSITCQCGDPSQELWFLEWTPWALIHGHLPFLSNAIFTGQGGINELVNTSWMLPALALAPVTFLWGPIASFNVAAVVAPAFSAWCFFLAARRCTAFVPGQILGALLYGFSPFVLQNEPFGHLNFTLVFFPPLAFLLLYDLLVDHRYPPRRVGIGLALLVIAEFFTSTELLAMSVIVMVTTLAIVALLRPSVARGQVGRVVVAGTYALVLAGVVLAWPVWFTVAGPRHITGLVWAGSPDLGTSAGAAINPGASVHSASIFDIVGGYPGDVGPNAGPFHLPSLVYFGPLLVVFLLVSMPLWRRRTWIWTVALSTVLAWTFSFGTSLGTETGVTSTTRHPWWLPWRLFSHLPLVANILPTRFAVLATGGVALLFTVSLDAWRDLLADRHWNTTGTSVLLTAAGALTLVPVALAAPVPFVVTSTPPPAWFTDSAPRLPLGTVVLVLPFEGQQAMGWQAQTGLHFDLAGGFGVVPGPTGASTFSEPPTTGPVAILNRLSPPPVTPLTWPLPTSAADVATVRQAIDDWRVQTTVITNETQAPGILRSFFTRVYQRPPRRQEGSWVWSGPPSLPTS